MLQLLAVTLLPIWLSLTALKRYVPGLDRPLSLGLALLVPIMCISWMTLLLSIWLNAMLAVYIVTGMIVGAAALMGWVNVRTARTKIPALIRKRVREVRSLHVTALLGWLCAAALLLLFAVLLFTHSAFQRPDGWYSGGSTWGDLPLHLTYIHSFVRQDTLSLVSPLFAQKNTTYPFLFDWYTSILVRSGASVQTALILSQLQVLTAVVLLAIALLQKISRRPSVTALTLILFFFGGGLGWWYFWGDWKTSGMELVSFLQQQPWQFTNMPVRGVFFSTIIPDLLLPQRGFSVGLAVMLAVSVLIVTVAQNATSTESVLTDRIRRRLLGMSSIIIGLLPFFHVHSFFWTTGLWVIAATILGAMRPKYRKTIVAATLILGLFAVGQIVWFAANGAGEQFVRWQPGWMITFSSKQTVWSTLWLALVNFGVTTVALLVLPFRLPTLVRRNPLIASMIAYSWLVFVACLFISFQPWPYDNIKFMMLSYFFLCCWGGLELAGWWGSWKKGLVIAIVVIGTASSMLSVIREAFVGMPLATAQEVHQAAALRTILEPGAVTLTANDHNHPIPMLVGQPIVMGYPGWLWSHGISYTTTETSIAQIYAGIDVTPQLLNHYHIRYVYISNRERNAFDINEGFWASNYPVVFAQDDAVVYDVQATKN